MTHVKKENVQSLPPRFQVIAKGHEEVEAWESGLVELLYCDRKDAAKLLQTGKNEKYSAGK